MPLIEALAIERRFMPPPQAPLQRSAPVHAVTPAVLSRKLDLKTAIGVGRAADFDVVSTESCCGGSARGVGASGPWSALSSARPSLRTTPRWPRPRGEGGPISQGQSRPSTPVRNGNFQ